MYTACRFFPGQGIHYMVNLMVVSVSWALQIGSKKNRNAKKMFLKSYEHFSDEHVWDVSKICIRTFGTSHLFNFAHDSQNLTFFVKSCQDLWVDVKVETHLVGTHRVFLISDIFTFSRSWQTWYHHGSFEKHDLSIINRRRVMIDWNVLHFDDENNIHLT